MILAGEVKTVWDVWADVDVVVSAAAVPAAVAEQMIDAVVTSTSCYYFLSHCHCHYYDFDQGAKSTDYYSSYCCCLRHRIHATPGGTTDPS